MVNTVTLILPQFLKMRATRQKRLRTNESSKKRTFASHITKVFTSLTHKKETGKKTIIQFLTRQRYTVQRKLQIALNHMKDASPHS